jgi:hypothetical protein
MMEITRNMRNMVITTALAVMLFLYFKTRIKTVQMQIQKEKSKEKERNIAQVRVPFDERPSLAHNNLFGDNFYF